MDLHLIISKKVKVYTPHISKQTVFENPIKTSKITRIDKTLLVITCHNIIFVCGEK